MAPATYQTREPMEPWHVFVIDVTAHALLSGVTACMCAASKAAIGALAEQPHAKVAVAAYDTRVHFFSLASGAAASVIVMADIDVRFLRHPTRTLCLALLHRGPAFAGGR